MAKRIVDEEMRFTVVVNGNAAQKELYELEQANRKLKSANTDLRKERAQLFREGKKGTAEYKALTDQINKNSVVIGANAKRMDALQKEIGITGLSLNQLRRRAAILGTQLRNMIPGSADFNRIQAELKQVTARMRELQAASRNTEGSLSKIAGGFNKYAVLGTSIIASFTGIAISLQKTIDYQKEFSDALSDVQKTTGMTKKEVDDLSRTFGFLNTRTSRIDLLKIAEEGGRIGIAKDEIGEFVKVMDKAVVALSDSFPGGVEETASKLGKLKLLFKETKDQGVDKAYNAIGSAINELGANGVATENNIAEFATRVGSLPESMKPSIADALALGAAFEESGIQAEIAARAYGIVLKQAAEESAKFAEVMGITNQEVKDLINEDPLEFMIKFAQGLKGMNATDTANTLNYLGVSADGANKVLGAVSNNTARFREQLALSSKAMREATSLTNEFNTKNNNLAANLDKIKKTLIGAFNSEALTKALSGLTSWFGRLIGAIKDTTDAAVQERNELFKLESMIFNVNTTTADRVKLINKLKTLYPDLLKDINAETVSNEQLKVALKAVNDQLINKIIIAREQDKIDRQNEKTADRLQTYLEKEMELREAVGAMAGDTKGFSFDSNKSELENAIALADQYLKNAGRTPSVIKQVSDGYFALKNSISAYKSAQYQLNREQKEGNILLNEREALMKRLGISDAPAPSSTSTTTDTTETATSTFNVGGNKENDKKAAEEKLKLIKSLNEDIAEANKKAEDERLALLDAGYLKELQKLKLAHDREKAALWAQIKTKEELAEMDPEVAEKYLERNEALLNQMLAQDTSYHLERATIIEKGITDYIQSLEDEYQRAKSARETAFNNELALLGDNEKAKEQLKKEYQAEELAADKAHLEELMTQLKTIISEEEFEGFKLDLFSEEQKQNLIKRLEEAGLKLSEIQAIMAALQGKGGGTESGLDIQNEKTDFFGFTADEWLNVFKNLDDTRERFNAMIMTIGVLRSAWSDYNNYLKAGEDAKIKQYERNQQRMKAVLDQRLASGMINQRQYDQAVKAGEEQVAKQKAEIEYKQAKREKAQKIVDTIINTSVAIMQGYAQLGPIGGTIAAVLIGTLGALQIATIARQPLPAKGFQTGYYDSFPVEREQDGKLFNASFGGQSRSGMVSKPTVFLAGEQGQHFPELIVSGPDLKKFDPEVVSSIGREIRRVKGYEQGYTSPAVARAESPAAVAQDNSALLAVLSEVSQTMREIKEKGLNAWLVRDMENAKKMQDDLDKLKKYKQKSQV